MTTEVMVATTLVIMTTDVGEDTIRDMKDMEDKILTGDLTTMDMGDRTIKTTSCKGLRAMQDRTHEKEATTKDLIKEAEEDTITQENMLGEGVDTAKSQVMIPEM